ncbi:hypothetical protein ACROYT_G035429 [Oculina patagonica]
MTSVDNSFTMPVGVHYHPKSVSGEDMLSQVLGTAKTVQVCDRCLAKQPAKNHIVTHDSAQCNSKCDRRLQMKAVCQECQRKGHVSYLPALRCCESCLEDSVQCRKVAVLAVVTDCEECNKQALLEIQKMSENNTMPPELLLLTPLPDVVHIDSDIRKPLRKMLSLECVRNKDRMAVEPIVRLTRPEVIEALSKVSLVVHTLVPEKCRFWTSNQQGVCCHPVAICPGPLGIVLALDYDFNTSCSRLLKIRLHQPTDVAELQNGLKDSRDLCFSSGVAYIAERGNACIRFEDLDGKVRLNPNSLRSRADLERTLGDYNLSIDGTVPTLRAKSPYCNGGLYCFDMESSEVTTVLENMTNNCKEIKKVVRFKDTLVFTDVEGRQVKRYNPSTKKVETLAGDGREGAQDGAGKCCSFVQVQGICCVSDTLFITDAAAKKIKIVTGLSGTTDFLKHLGILYDTFGITCKGCASQPITPEQVSQNLNTVHEYIKTTVRNVKETNNLKDDSATNGPQGTVSQKTQTSIELLLNGVKGLMSKIAMESLKRITKWGAKYFTHPSSYYPVPQTGMSFQDVQFMTPLPPEALSKKEEETMKEWLENYRPVRQRTVRSETTKDKAGALPPAVYSNSNPNATTRVYFLADQVEQTPTASSEISSIVTNVSVLSFVSDANVHNSHSRQLLILAR